MFDDATVALCAQCLADAAVHDGAVDDLAHIEPLRPVGGRI
jgi:hypothetical protein